MLFSPLTFLSTSVFKHFYPVPQALVDKESAIFDNPVKSF